MRVLVRFLVVAAFVALAFVGLSSSRTSVADASTPRVTIIDNDAPTPEQGIDQRTGQWGFSPANIVVLKGDAVVFNNPPGNFQPHNVVSITRAGTSAAPQLESGAKFSSGTAQENLLHAGSGWVLDTSPLDAGYYTYFCTLHPWMVGTITVLTP